MTHRWSTNLVPFGPTGDRFNTSGFRSDITTREKLVAARQIVGLDGVELHYPTLFVDDTPEEIKSFLDEVGLACSVVSPAMSSDPRWQHGSLSNDDAAIRREAILRVQEAMDVAVVLGAHKLNVWLGQDGFDYPFQIDYRRAWRNLVESIAACASHNPDVKLCIESKMKQPRARSLLGTVSKVLLLIHDVGLANVGCLFDTGHAFFAHENLAEYVTLLDQYGKLFHLHFNDNYGDWDWDMTVGSVHHFEFFEMLYWLKKIGYEGWYSLDQFPQREDPIQALTTSIRAVKRMEEVLDTVDEEMIASAIKRHDPLAVYEMLAVGERGGERANSDV